MTRPMMRIHNVETNEVIDREMNDEEFADFQADKLRHETKIALAEAKAEAKTAAQAKLAALGLTVEDLQALGL
jgi:hypothetical protein